MIKHIHILGPSGSGTTTIAKKIKEQYGYTHFDADDYFWKKTEPLYQKLRSIEERQRLLKKDLKDESHWIISGSFCGWGDIFRDDFDLVIYLWAPIELRLRRLRQREQRRFGNAVLPGGKMFERHQKFLKSAASYDYDQTEFRNKRTHEEWMQKLDCPILRIDAEKKPAEILEIVAEKIKSLEN